MLLTLADMDTRTGVTVDILLVAEIDCALKFANFAVYILRAPVGGFNSIALSSVFYTWFKTMHRKISTETSFRSLRSLSF